MEIIGRKDEQYAIQQYFISDKPEFVAVYGRRRVGKTFLIKEFFAGRFSFYISGLANATKAEQLDNFAATLTAYGKKSEPAAQVDLLIERNDNIINLCEMKYANNEFVIDKNYDKALRNKRSAFKSETKTRKAVHITMVTTYGVKHNEYWNNIQSEVIVNDLFK
ncbi:hypothetical protein FACS1894155_12260 [Bacteroidia bacterium]|nr:hypothetical protein FACS1894155_12260 [Bacteroidia bacterium]